MEDDEPDYDAMIDDYIEDSFEPPPEDYDDAYLEQMMEEHHHEADTANDNSKQRSSPRQAHSESPVNDHDDEDDVSSVAGSTASSVRQELDRARGVVATDLFSFERFKNNSNWRDEQSGSPKDTMKAKEWKSNDTVDLLASTTTATLLASRRAKSRAPDSQLVEFQATKSDCLLQWPRQASTRPIVGESSLPMTLGDGTRVYLRRRDENESLACKYRSSRQRHTLGVPMDELMRRVRATRRRREHEQQDSLRRELKRLENDDDDDGDDEWNGHEPSRDEGSDQLWVDKHAPSAFAHLLSDERTNREVVRALRAWDPYVFHRDPPPRPNMGFTWNEKSTKNAKFETPAPGIEKRNPRDRRPEESERVLLLSGPPGIGKSTLAHIIARHVGYRPLEVNGSDERSASALTERVVRAMESNTLNLTGENDSDSLSCPNCLILDEIDGADAKSAISALVEIIRAEIPARGARGKSKTPYLRRPIIFICNNKFAPALKPLLPYARQFNVNPPSATRLVSRLVSVLHTENMVVSGGSSLLNQLVTLTGGDIRSCLHTLQFAAARAKELALLKEDDEPARARGKAAAVDISKALMSAVNGDGMKDGRNDIAATITSIFRKEKRRKVADRFGAGGDARPSSDRVLDAVQGFGENSRILDSLFTNLLRVSYVDPTLDRCAAAHEWLSGSDLYRLNAVDSLGIPSAAAAIHLLCRVERPDLSYSVRDIADARYKLESNQSLTQKFLEGLSPNASCRSSRRIASEAVPFILWVLSAGEGSSALDRAASSMELLNSRELDAFQKHASTLRWLGLTYAASRDVASEERKSVYRASATVCLEPAIDRLIQFVDLNLDDQRRRREIPPPMKELLAHRAAHEKMVLSGEKAREPTHTQAAPNPTVAARLAAKPPIKLPALAPANVPSKESPAVVTAQNFLGIGARKAKEARSARTAARVGFQRASKKQKVAHTGSGVPFPRVIRLKYVKGFTEAVRTPCAIDELA